MKCRCTNSEEIHGISAEARPDRNQPLFVCKQRPLWCDPRANSSSSPSHSFSSRQSYLRSHTTVYPKRYSPSSEKTIDGLWLLLQVMGPCRYAKPRNRNKSYCERLCLESWRLWGHRVITRSRCRNCIPLACEKYLELDSAGFAIRP